MARIDTRNVARQGNNGTVKKVIEQLADRTAGLPDDGSGGVVSIENVTYTVAADGDPAGVNDFDSLEEALRYLNDERGVQLGKTILELNDGNHFSIPGYVKVHGVRLTIIGASRDKSLCFITKPVGSTEGHLLSFGSYAHVTIMNVTLDPVVGGGEALNAYIGVNVADDTYCTIYQCDIKNIRSASKGGRGIEADSHSQLTLRDVFITNCTYGMHLYSNAFIYVTGSLTIDACDEGMNIDESSFRVGGHGSTGSVIITNCPEIGINNSRSAVRTGSSIAPVFTGNLVDFNLPLNEIQYDGSYVSDGQSAMSFKA